MDSRVNSLINAVGKLRDLNTSRDDLLEVKEALNNLLMPDAECTNFIYTWNVDKLPFGLIVFPKFVGHEINDLVTDGKPIRFTKYEVEIDSKAFDYGLTDEEVVAVLLYNIYHLVADFIPCNRLLDALNIILADNGKNIVIRDSVQYKAILELGCVDTLAQMCSCLNLPNEVVEDPYLEQLEIDCFDEARRKLYREIPGCENETKRKPDVSMLKWAIRLYDNVDMERIPALHMLTKIKELTASVLYTNKINLVINALNRIDTDYMIEGAVDSIISDAKKSGSILGKMNYTGLKDIEDDLYEFRVRVKNAETDEDAMYTLREINARLSVLEDYIKTHAETDPEIERWDNVRTQFRDLRDMLSSLKVYNKKEYESYINYNIGGPDDE